MKIIFNILGIVYLIIAIFILISSISWYITKENSNLLIIIGSSIVSTLISIDLLINYWNIDETDNDLWIKKDKLRVMSLIFLIIAYITYRIYI